MQGIPGYGPMLAAGYGPGSFLKQAPGGSIPTAKADQRGDDDPMTAAGPISAQGQGGGGYGPNMGRDAFMMRGLLGR